MRFNRKKVAKSFGISKNITTFAPANKKKRSLVR